MRYEKATAEVVDFGSLKVFMKLSSGKPCGMYGIIETLDAEFFACYYVTSRPDPQSVFVYATCEEVDGFEPGTYLVSDVITHYDEIVP